MRTWGGLAVAVLAMAQGCGGEGGGGTGPTTVVEEDIATATTWKPSAEDCDVQVKRTLEVSAKLTIEPGTRICFDANAGLRIAETGSLSAVGTPDQKIVFTGASPTKGFWKGLAFESNNIDNKLIHAEISYGGANEAHCCGFFFGSEEAIANLVLGDYNTAAGVQIQNTTLSHSGGYGIFAFEGAKLDGFANNRFAANEKAPLTIFFDTAGLLDAASVYSGGAEANGTQVVRVLDDSDITRSVTFKKLDVPWGMGFGAAGSVFTLRAQVAIEAGARLEFEANSGLLVQQEGRLTASGTAGNRVVLTGRSPTKGFWKGLAFLSVDSSLTQTDVTFGGNDDPFCCGFFEPGGGPSTQAAVVVGDAFTSGGLTITDVAVTNSGNRGVSVLKGSVTQLGTNDLLTGNLDPNLGI